MKKDDIRIMFLTYSLKGGGAERMVSRLANGFIKRGYQVEIGLFDISDPAYEINPNIKIVDFSAESNSRIKRIVTHIKKIRNYLNFHSIDIIFVFMASLIPFAVLARNKHVKIIGAERTNPKIVKRRYREYIKVFSPLCDGFIFQTNGAKKCYPVKVQNYSVVIGNIAPKVQYIRQDKEPMSICSVGRLHKDKDFSTLIKAFHMVVKRYPEAKLHIFGEGPLKDILMKMAGNLSVQDNIIWEGFSRNLLEDIQKYEVFVFSSKAEGMPNALIEAMTIGMPCISSDCDYGPSDLIENNKNGFLTPVGNYEIMGTKILELLENKELQNEFSIEAMKTMKNYSEDYIIDKYITYMYKILNVENVSERQKCAE